MKIFQKNVLNIFLTLGCITFLIIIWKSNSSILGDLFDYSNMAIAAAGRIKAGLLPYRDFTTSLQSLPIYIAYICEFLFGENYSSLVIGNLLLTIVFFIFTIYFTKNNLSYQGSLFIASSFCITTSLQHGIIWYNSLAFVLVMMGCIYTSSIISKQFIEKKDIFILSLLSLILGMTKINFNIVGISLIICLLLASMFVYEIPRQQIVITIIFIGMSGILLPPLIESWVNGVGVSTWWENVIVIPSGRVNYLEQVKTGTFWFGISHDYYPRNYSAKIVLEAMVFYMGVTGSVFCSEEQFWHLNGFKRIGAISFILLSFFIGTSLIILTNHETQMLTSALFLVGLVCSEIGFSPKLFHVQRLFLKFSIFSLAAIMFFSGSVSALRHSRLDYGYRDLHTPAPLVPAKDIHPALSSYYENISFGPVYAKILKELFKFLEQEGIWKNPDDIYWGPGFEFMNRVVGTQFPENVPLWYHLGTSVRESDAEKLIPIIKRYRWVVAHKGLTVHCFPSGIREFLEKNYDTSGNGILLFKRREK